MPPASFDAAAQAAYIAQFANTSGVPPGSITLSVVPATAATAVLVNATIRTPDEAAAQTVLTELDSAISESGTSGTFMGAPVVEPPGAPIVTEVAVPARSLPPPSPA
eukprot:3504729-Prymnesium_polylepis.1